jgi:anti-sigma-K factor RskA
MNYQRPQLIDRLASEYVLGTLRGPARRRFEAWTRAYIPARRAVHWWEQRLAQIAMDLPAVAPPARVWSRIEQRIAPHTRPREDARRSSAPLWQALAAGLAAVAIGLLAVLTLREPQVQERVQIQVQVQAVQPSQTAIVADTTAPLWVVNAFPETQQLQVRALRPIPVDPNRVFELWMLPTSGAAPVSLGLLPATGTTTLPLPAAAAQLLAASSTLAVSIEPLGGSPTGAPTGPVVYTAPLVQSRG